MGSEFPTVEEERQTRWKTRKVPSSWSLPWGRGRVAVEGKREGGG